MVRSPAFRRAWGAPNLIDTAGIALRTMEISQGIYLSHQLRREVTPAEINEHAASTAVGGL